MDDKLEAISDAATNNCYSPSTSETLSDINQAKLDSLEKKAVHLRLVLERDFKAADIKWSLFVAAAFSFRYESCLRPFPPNFMKNGIKDMDTLLSIITEVPALDLVLKSLDNLQHLPNISHIIDLLFYVLVRLKEPSLKTVPMEAHETIMANAYSTVSTPRPQYIFQVTSSFKSNVESKWKELAKNHHTFFAYHGSRLENFYSILHFGIQQHLNKSSLGSGVCGVYLSHELNTSLPLSHGGFGWGASFIGGHLSCVAMCEVIDVPEGINYKKPVSNEGDGISKDQKTKSVEQSTENALQYIVTNYDLVRIRYLLVYVKQPTSMRFPIPRSNRTAGGLRQWLSKHKIFSILLGYGLMLATIGFANNQPIHHYYNILWKKLDFVYSNVKM